MDYILLEKLYYKDRKKYENEYLNRFNSISTVKLNIEINKNQAFFIITPEMTNQIIEINEVNNRLNDMTNTLPGIALNQYIKKCLIDEIVLTNEIEGVISTRRDINEILENVKHTEDHRRLLGLVNKYMKLNSDEKLSIRNCQDIRDIYKELLWEEILNDDPANLPDGVYFRKNGVDVKSKFGKVIHKGIMPEDEINRIMTKALDILNDNNIAILFRIAIFHYLFGYIHPFYDGNGRVSRFISSYLLSKNLNILTGFRLAYTIKENISLYYTGFKTVNEEKNKGDITPFIISFFDIIIKMLNKLCSSLSERIELIDYYYEISHKISDKDSERSIIFILFQQTLFGELGIGINDLIEASEESEYKVRQTVNKLKELGLLKEEKLGKKPLYSFDMKVVANEYCEN
ncbi:MAG: Fic family protein [Clostridia bacterium]|nr:Fic family protein [Clostridia bacterium]